MITRSIVLVVSISVTALVAWLWPRLDRPPSRFAVARQLLHDNRPQAAALLFEAPIWRGVAEYRAGRYERALGDFYSEQSILALYNLGTTHARMQEWPHAAAHLEKVLRLDPHHADAQHNLAIALQAMALARSQTAENPREQPLAGEGEDKQEPSTPASADPSPTPPGNTDAGENPSEDASEAQSSHGDAPGALGEEERTAEPGTAVAIGESADQGARRQREVLRSTLLKARESTQAAEILLRHIQDDPQKVLRARLYTAYHAKKTRGQP